MSHSWLERHEPARRKLVPPTYWRCLMRRIQWRNVLRPIQWCNVLCRTQRRNVLHPIQWRNVLRPIQWRNVVHRCFAFLLALSCLLQQAIAQDASPLPTFEELEAEGAIIGEIRIDNQNIFNLDDPRENNGLYRAATGPQSSDGHCCSRAVSLYRRR